jgi:F0F1-type ATP synthase epsilon subunit
MAMRQDASTGEMVEDKSAEPVVEDPKKPTMDIKIYAPFKVYFQGKGYSISAANDTGPFDILPHHHNFLCMLLPGDIVVRTPFDTKTIKISRALMHVTADDVTVFVDV